MHLEVLVEDSSGKKALDILVPKIIGNGHTFTVHEYRGVGRIPRNMNDASDAGKRILLDNLPKLLRGYGRTFINYPANYQAAVILVCDLDNKCLSVFRQELLGILNACNPRPTARFCIAVEEGEAWLLGDPSALKSGYPKAKSRTLNTYVNDAICGTWEKLADAIYPGGAKKLAARGWQAVGAEKSKWAGAIAPRMDIAHNNSPSFCYFRDKLQALCQ